MTQKEIHSIEASPNGFKKYLPHLVVLGIFLVIAAFFCSPWLQGQKLLPHDVEQWLKMSKETRDYRDATGETSFWMNNDFAGMPSALTDPYSENNWFSKIKNATIFYKHGENMNPILLFFWAMVGGFLLALSLKIRPWLAGIAGVAFAFSTYNPIIIAAGHTTKMLDIAYVPGILAGMVLAYRGKYWIGAAIAGLYTAFALDAGHYQIIYYSLFAIMALSVSELVKAIKHKELKRFLIASAFLAAVAGLAAGTAASRLMLTQEVSQYTMRGDNKELQTEENDKGLDKDYAFKWSNGVEETFALMVPNLYGGGHLMKVNEHSDAAQDVMNTFRLQPAQLSGLAYWGPQQEDGLGGSVYFGIVIVFLAILSILVVRSHNKWWLVAASVLFIVISWGKNFAALNYLLFDTLPMMNKFRSPNMAMAITSMLFPILAVWALNDILTGKVSKEEAWKKVRMAFLITGGILLLVLIAIYSMMDFTGKMDPQIFGQSWAQVSSKIIAFRKSMASKDAWRSILFLLLATGVLWAFTKDKINTTVATVLIALLVIIDILPIANRYLGSDKYMDEAVYDARFAPRPVDKEILKDNTYYRVLDLSADLFNSADASYHHKTIGGYHPAKLQIYQDLIMNQLGGLNSAVVNMLNGKYIINPDQTGKKLMAIPNPGALGNAWFVSHIQKVKTAREEMDALNAPSLSNPADTGKGNFNPGQTVLVRESEMPKLGMESVPSVDSTAGIELTSYSPMKLTYKSKNAQEGIAVFSEIYYPLDWEAKIDGKTVPIARANYVLRALKIPAGEHTIEMIYNTPGSFAKGETITLICSIILLIFILAGLYFYFTGKQKSRKSFSSYGI